MSNSLPTAIITGASRGIGRALAILLAQNNFQLSLVARNKGELKDLIEEDKKLDCMIDEIKTSFENLNEDKNFKE